MMKLAWRRFYEAVDGLKTLGTAAIIFALGLADYLDVVNVRPVLEYLLGDNLAAKIMIALPIIFGTLRFVTSGKVRWFRGDCNDQDEGH